MPTDEKAFTFGTCESHAWMIPAFPIGAIAISWILVFGGLWLWKHAGDHSDSAASAVDAAFDKVISEKDWIAAGLPSESSRFVPYHFSENAQQFASERTVGKRGMKGSLQLDIDVPDHVAELRVGANWEDAQRLKVAEGFHGDAHDPARSWRVLARRRVGDDQYEDLMARCFHDGVYVRVWTRGVATRAQAEGFQRLIEAASSRLAVACTTDLRTYIDRVATQAKLRVK